MFSKEIARARIFGLASEPWKTIDSIHKESRKFDPIIGDKDARLVLLGSFSEMCLLLLAWRRMDDWDRNCNKRYVKQFHNPTLISATKTRPKMFT